MAFQITLSGMLSSIVSLRWHQFRWTMAYWARAFGLLPASGKWGERITFVYIYVLIVALMVPAAASIINALYLLELKATPELQVATLYTTIPALIGVLSLFLIAFPWKAWMLRLTFGDITYLAASPFDRRVLALWRFIEVVFAIGLVCLIPLTLLAPVLANGSILAVEVLPAIGRGALALALWVTPMLALGWHLSLQEYVHNPPPVGVRWIARLSVIVAAGVLLVTNPAILLWPGRLIVLISLNQGLFGWPLLIVYAMVGLAVIALTSRQLSMTRVAAGSDVFARIQQLGFMIVMDRQLLLSILGEARANESYAVGTLPHATGILTLVARTALFYRRQYGQAVQLIGTGIAFGLALIFWRPFNLPTVIVTVVLLVLLLPPSLARVFRSDLSVPFVMQFIPQPLTRRLLAASVVPFVLLLTGLLPVLIGFNRFMPDWAWGIAPVIWVLTLIGHVEIVGKRNSVSDRNLFSVILGSIAVFVIFWTATSTDVSGVFALFQGVVAAGSVSFALMLIAEARSTGLTT